MTVPPLPPVSPSPQSFRGMRVGVGGLGIEGRDAVAFLSREGATITVFDRRPTAEIKAELAEAGSATAADQGDLERLTGIDALIASQGVPHPTPLLQEAHRRGIPVYGPLAIFLERCRSRCHADLIGITGSAGKTTTSTLVARILEADGRRVVLGGNIGRGLLAQLDDLTPQTAVVAEISHTQLLRAAVSPSTAALLNVTPNHLDQFSWDQYQSLKRRIVAYQSPSDTAVLPWDDPSAASTATAARIVRFGEGSPPVDAPRAAYAQGGRIWWRSDGAESPVAAVDALQIPGRHNLRNALAATALAASLGASTDAIGDTLRTFTGVPHRLERIAVVCGVAYVNDSIATAPERTLAGLRSIETPIVLLLGGRDKRLPLEPLIDELRSRARTVVTFGEVGSAWSAELRRHGIAVAATVDTLDDALPSAVRHARAGDTVLLSPGGTSFDQYPNFEARGEHFRRLVHSLPAAGESMGAAS